MKNGMLRIIPALGNFVSNAISPPGAVKKTLFSLRLMAKT
jgi:hypothetical protein